jgi:hypothetical protein
VPRRIVPFSVRIRFSGKEEARQWQTMINLQLFHGKLLLIFYEFHGIGGWLIKPIHMDASTLVSRPKAED